MQFTIQRTVWYDLFTFMANGYIELTNKAYERQSILLLYKKVFQISGSYAGSRYTSKLL